MLKRFFKVVSPQGTIDWFDALKTAIVAVASYGGTYTAIKAAIAIAAWTVANPIGLPGWVMALASAIITTGPTLIDFLYRFHTGPVPDPRASSPSTPPSTPMPFCR